MCQACIFKLFDLDEDVDSVAKGTGQSEKTVRCPLSCPNHVPSNVNNEKFTNDPSANIYKNINKYAVHSNVVTSKRSKTKKRVSKNDTADPCACAKCSALRR